MEHHLGGSELGCSTEIVDGQKLTVFRIPQGAMLQIKLPDGTAFEMTAPPGGFMFIAEKDFDEIEATNKALLGELN